MYYKDLVNAKTHKANGEYLSCLVDGYHIESKTLIVVGGGQRSAFKFNPFSKLKNISF